MKNATIIHVSDERAMSMIRKDLPKAIDKLIRKAHKQGARGREAYAELNLNPLLQGAARALPEEFEDYVKSLVPAVWTVFFGKTVDKYHSIGTIFIRLK